MKHLRLSKIFHKRPSWSALFRPFRPKASEPRRTLYPFGGFRSERLLVTAYFFATVVVLLSGRAFVIHMFPPSPKILAAIAQNQYQTDLDLSASRGNIYDRKREPLAISVKRPSLVVNPRQFHPTKAEISMLARVLRTPPRSIVELSKKRSYFSWLKRKVPDDVASRVINMNLKGVHQVMEMARFYPAGSSASQLIGFVGVDNSGLSGIEQRYDRFLRGPTFNMSRSRDALNRPILFQPSLAEPEKSGLDVYLTIDLALQEIAEKALAQGLSKAKAKRGFAIVSDPHTGRLLAVANAPEFSASGSQKSLLSATNHALMDTFEPGSILKPFVVAEAMTLKRTTPESRHDCENGTYREQNWAIHDDHPKKDLSTTEVIVHSSNICIYKIAKTIGPNRLYDALLRFGFSERDHALDFPGQAFGKIADPDTWKPVRFANISFGQGLAVTGIELVQAYGAIANGGNLLKPYMIDRLESVSGEVIRTNTTQLLRKVMPPDVARSVRAILREVVEEGTGKNARMAEYSSAGKTGTSEKIDPIKKAYAPDLRIASFIGFAPATDPHLVIYVMIDEPGQKPYYGGTWAAPVFREIAEKSLKYMNVAPDRVLPVKLAQNNH